MGRDLHGHIYCLLLVVIDQVNIANITFFEAKVIRQSPPCLNLRITLECIAARYTYQAIALSNET